MPDISALLNGATAFANSFIPLLLTGIAVVAGLVLIYKAIRGIYEKGSERSSGGPGQVGFGGLAFQLLIGGMCLRLGASMEDVSQLLFGTGIQDVSGVLAYAPLAAQAGIWRQVLEVCLLWVVMLGWAGAFRGLLLWNLAASGGASGGSSGDHFWRGTWHLIGGAAAVNMTGMIQSFLGN